MEYNNIKFDAIVATPGCGKSYVCDKYPNQLVDVDEERLKCKYNVPKNITRAELESSKGNRNFSLRHSDGDYISELYTKLDLLINQGKTLIAAPHDEAIRYLIRNNIKFCFVYPKIDMQNEITQRMIKRGNPLKMIEDNNSMFNKFYQSNLQENKSVVHYQFGKNEFLEDIMIKFGFVFEKYDK